MALSRFKKYQIAKHSMDFWWKESQRLFNELMVTIYTDDDESKYNTLKQQYEHANRRYTLAKRTLGNFR